MFNPFSHLRRFGLKTLLVIVTGISLCVGYFAIKAHQVASLKWQVAQLDGQLTFTFEVDEHEDPTGAPHPVPRLIRTWIGDDYFVTPYSVVFFNENITDHDLNFLSDNSAAQRIQRLEVHNCQITDDTLAKIAHLTKLEWLELPGTGISNGGIHFLGKLPNLFFLNVNFTAVDDDAIDDVKELEQLEAVIIPLTEEGVRRLQAELPNCEVHTTYNSILAR